MSEDTHYYGTYCRLDHQSADSGIKVDGNSWSVGQELEMTPQLHITERGKEVPRVILGSGDKAAGFVPPATFKQLKKYLDSGWACRALVSFVAYYEPHKRYWLEVAIICYDPKEKDTFDRFVAGIAERIAQGDHPKINLSAKELSRVRESHGEWCDTEKMQLPDLERGNAYFKTHRTRTEKIAGAAASGNKGCYVGLVAAVVIIVAAICFIVLR